MKPRIQLNKKLFTLGICAAILSQAGMAQYQKMNFATNYVSGTNVSNGPNAVGFHPTNASAFSISTGVTTFTGGSIFGGSTDVATYSFGVKSATAHDTIYLKIQSAPGLLGGNDVTLSHITIQPLNGVANAGSAGSPAFYNYPSITGSALSDGRMLIYVASAPFDGVKITYNATGGLSSDPALSLYEAFYKSPGTQWPQDCDRPYESITNVSGVAIGGSFNNPYDVMDNGANYQSTYSDMIYGIGSLGAQFTQEIYFPSPGSDSDEIQLLTGVPVSLLSLFAEFGGTLGNQISVQPYLNNTAMADASSLQDLITIQFGAASTLVNLLVGNTLYPIYYKPGVPFNKVVLRWNVGAGLGTLNEYAFYDIRRVPNAPKIQAGDSEAVCAGTSGLQLIATSGTGEPGLQYRWYTKNPRGSVDSVAIGSDSTFTVPDSYLATPGRKVFYVAAVRSVCSPVLSDADSVIVQVYAKPVFTNSPLPDGVVGVPYANSVISTDSAATYTVSDLPPGLSFDQATNTIGGTPTAGGEYDVIVNATPVSGLCPSTTTYHVIITDPSATPVTVYNFSGEITNGTANLSWATGVEDNFDYFEIEKSIDGKVFNVIPDVKIQAAGSNSQYKINIFQSEAKAYYKLLAVDKDGSTADKGKVIVLTQSAANTGILVYPSPAHGSLTIDGLETGSSVVILSANGQAVKSFNASASTQKIDISNLPAGVYFVKVLSKGGKNVFTKFIVK